MHKVCLSQYVNFDKSTIFFNKITPISTRLLISKELGVCYLNTLKRYLRLPNMIGQQKKASFQRLKDRLKLKVEEQATRFLS